MSNWDDEGTYFTLGIPLPDIDSHNGVTQGRAPNVYKDIPTFTEYHTSSGSEEDPTDEQIQRSPINLSMTIQMIPTAPHPSETRNTNMSIAMAITTQLQSHTPAGGAGPSGGGPPGAGGGGGPPGGGGAPGGNGQGGGNAQPAQQEGKPMGTLSTIFKGDCSKAESFIREFFTYLLVNHDVPALASFI